MLCAVTHNRENSLLSANKVADKTISLQVSNAIIDHYGRILNAREREVLLFISRKTLGFQKEVDSISISQFCETTGYCARTIKYATKSLAEKGLIHKTVFKRTTRAPRPLNQYALNVDAILAPETERRAAKKLHKLNSNLSFGEPVLRHENAVSNKSLLVQEFAQYKRNPYIAMPYDALPIEKGQGFATKKEPKTEAVEKTRNEHFKSEGFRPKKEPDKPDSVQPGPTKIAPEPMVVKEESPSHDKTKARPDQAKETKEESHASRGSYAVHKEDADRSKETGCRNKASESPRNEAKRCEQYKRSPIQRNAARLTIRPKEEQDTLDWLKTLGLNTDEPTLGYWAHHFKRKKLEDVWHHIQHREANDYPIENKGGFFRKMLGHERIVTPQVEENRKWVLEAKKRSKWQSLEVGQTCVSEPSVKHKEVMLTLPYEEFKRQMDKLWDDYNRKPVKYQEGERLPSYYEDD